MRTMANLLAVAAIAAIAAGCAKTNSTSPARYEQGLVIVLGGAGGNMLGEGKRIQGSLASAGVNRAIEVFEWSQGDVLEDQVDMSRNRYKADELARRVEEYEARYPGRPVHLVGISAGTGLIVWALEDLPRGTKVTGAVLLASSLGSRYDLTAALGNVTDAIYSFSSVADAVLGIGVTMTGPVDRSEEMAGGFAGFSPPQGAPESTRQLYKEKLVQRPWWPGDIVLGNLGDHIGTTSPMFIRARVSPLVMGHKGAEGEASAESHVTGGQASGQAGPEGVRAAGAKAQAKPTAGAAEKSRFVDWSVRAPAPARPPNDEAVYFAETGVHP